MQRFWSSIILCLSLSCSLTSTLVYADEIQVKLPEMITRISYGVFEEDTANKLTDADLNWEKTTRDAEWNYRNGSFGLAEKQLQTALKYAKEIKPVDRSLMASYFNLGIFYQFRGENKKAEGLYENAFHEQEKLVGEDSPICLISESRLAQFYMGEDNSHDARELLPKFIYRCQKDIQPIKSIMADEANKKSLSNQYLDLAVSLDDLASLCSIEKRYSDAEQLYKLSLQIRETILSPLHMAMAASWQNLGETYMAEHKNEAAEPLLQKAFIIRNKKVGLGSAASLSNANKFAESLVQEGKLTQAAEMYRRSIDAFSSKTVSPVLIASLVGLSEVYKRQGRYDAAAPLLKRAINIDQKMNGPQSASVSTLLDKYAEVLSKLKGNSEASSVRKRLKSTY